MQHAYTHNAQQTDTHT